MYNNIQLLKIHYSFQLNKLKIVSTRDYQNFPNFRVIRFKVSSLYSENLANLAIRPDWINIFRAELTREESEHSTP